MKKNLTRALIALIMLAGSSNLIAYTLPKNYCDNHKGYRYGWECALDTSGNCSKHSNGCYYPN